MYDLPVLFSTFVTQTKINFVIATEVLKDQKKIVSGHCGYPWNQFLLFRQIFLYSSQGESLK